MTRSRRAAMFTALVAAAATALAVPAINAAARAPAAARGPAGATVVSRHTVTMITGDVVQLARYSDGRQVATVRPPADRLQIGYSTQQLGSDVYVTPNDAVPLLANGTLDRNLFDVTKLVADGYDNAHSSTLPMIVQYPASRVRAHGMPSLRGTSPRLTLRSIHGAAVAEGKRQAHTFWTSLVGDPKTGAKPTSGAVKHV